MHRRKKLLVALWAAFGVLWAFIATEFARHPMWEPWDGAPVLLILQIAMVVMCGFMVVRLTRAGTG